MSGSSMTKRSPWQIQQAVLFALFIRELKTRVGGRWLGGFWLLLEPLVHVTLLMMLVTLLRRITAPGIEVPVFLVTGLMPFFIFKDLSVRLMDAIDANRGLFNYRQVKPIDALATRALLEVTLRSVVYALVLAALGWFGFHVIPARPLELIGVSAVLVMLGASFGLLFAVATDEFPKARVFIRMLFGMPLYLASGVIFSVHRLPPDVQVWLQWNPVLHLIELSRASFFPSYRAMQGVSLHYPAGLAVALAFFGMALYRVRRDQLMSAN